MRTAYLFIALLAITITLALIFMEGGVTGYQTFEAEQATGSTGGLYFDNIPNIIAKPGQEIIFKVEPNKEPVWFSDDTDLFNVTAEGVVRFKPSEKDIGRHNAWIIIKDQEGNHYYQNVAILIR